MNPYFDYVEQFARLLEKGKHLPLGGFSAPPPTAISPRAPKALIFSPHPDDEVIIGGLPLRLRRELGWNVINVAVTQGSNKARQEARLAELRACCQHIGFGLLQTAPCGLEGINPMQRQAQPGAWEKSVDSIAALLHRENPDAIFFPHDDDWNSTHIGTHHLVVDALRRMPADFTCLAVLTEFWGAMDNPNLMVASSPRDVADLITALTFHVGEVQRNPYHLRMPGWLIDNVRRGGELVGGQGGAAPDFPFATLYRLLRWQDQQLIPPYEGGRFVSTQEPLSTLFPTPAQGRSVDQDR